MRALWEFFVMLNNFFSLFVERWWWLLKWCNWIFFLCFRCCFSWALSHNIQHCKEQIACMFALITNTPTGYQKLLPYRIYVAYLSLPLTTPRGILREREENIINYGNGRVELSVGVSWKMPHRHEKEISWNTKFHIAKRLIKQFFCPRWMC